MPSCVTKIFCGGGGEEADSILSIGGVFRKRGLNPLLGFWKLGVDDCDANGNDRIWLQHCATLEAGVPKIDLTAIRSDLCHIAAVELACKITFRCSVFALRQLTSMKGRT